MIQMSVELLVAADGLFQPSGSNPTGAVEDDLVFTLELSDMDVALDLFMLVNIPRLMDLQVQSISSVYQLPCLLAIFEPDGLVPVAFNLTFGGIGFEVCCSSTCNSPLFATLDKGCLTSGADSALARTITDFVNTAVALLVQYVASSSAQDFLNQEIAQAITQCQAIQAGIPQLPTAAQPAQVPVASYMGIAGLAAVVTSFVGFALLVPVHFRRRDEAVKGALLDAAQMGVAGSASKEEFEYVERRLTSLFSHPVTPPWLRYGVPLCIVSNVVMFATANFAANGVTVLLEISFAGDQSVAIPVVGFDLATSIDDMWNAGAVALAIIIALASGAWPYAKQVLLLFAWFAPPTVLSADRRGSFLETLDILNKWSLIDLFVLVLMMVSFSFFVSASLLQLVLVPAGALSFSVQVAPGWGIYGFLFGTLGSLVVNHVCTFVHRRTMRADEDLQDAILGQLVKDLRTPRIRLADHRFNVLDADGKPYRYFATWVLLYLAGFGVVFALVVAGFSVPLVEFEYQGVFGLALNLVDADGVNAAHSIASLATSMSQAAAGGSLASVAGTAWLQIVYVALAVIAPLLLCVGVCVLWAVPLTLTEQLHLGFAIEVVWAWEAFIIAVFSVVVAVFQISELALFITDAASDSLCTLAQQPLQQLFPDEPSDQSCFNVVASMVPTGAVTAVAALALQAWACVAWRLCDAALTDRELAARRKMPLSPGDMTGLKGFLVRRALEARGSPLPPADGFVSALASPRDVMNAFSEQHGAFKRAATTSAAGHAPSSRAGSLVAVPLALVPAGGSVRWAGNPVLTQEAVSAANPRFFGGGPRAGGGGDAEGAPASSPLHSAQRSRKWDSWSVEV